MQGLNSADDGKDKNDDDDDDKPSNINEVRVECKSRSDIANNRGNWNSLKIIQKIHAPLTGKAQNQGTTNNSYIWHGEHILFSSY